MLFGSACGSSLSDVEAMLLPERGITVSDETIRRAAKARLPMLQNNVTAPATQARQGIPAAKSPIAAPHTIW